ncbi:toxin [Campylobacter fetus]|nr:toxin [Campylobacter fetus]
MAETILKHIKNSLILLFCMTIFNACSSKITEISTQKTDPLGSVFGKADLNFKQPTINLQGIPPDLFDRTSDSLVIMGANGVAITVWYSSPGNWLWGYALYTSGNLGGYRVWRLILLPDNEVMIVNFNTRTTCMNTYKNGVIHSPCNKNNPFQKFVLRPMTNGAVQIYNKATNSCLQTPVDNLFGFDVFGAINLTTKCTDTIDQQWYLLPPPQVGRLLY